MKKYNSEIKGIVLESLTTHAFRVKLENGDVISANLSSKMCDHKISVDTDDCVLVEITPYDPNHGRITFRYGR
jgi:translation initiation factor IF-1